MTRTASNVMFISCTLCFVKLKKNHIMLLEHNKIGSYVDLI